MKIDESMGVKILKINWNPTNDYFDFSVSPIKEPLQNVIFDIFTSKLKRCELMQQILQHL